MKSFLEVKVFDGGAKFEKDETAQIMHLDRFNLLAWDRSEHMICFTWTCSLENHSRVTIGVSEIAVR